ncbi:MAG: hypothetical protein Q8R25_00855 [bacterium]|nr:hypothetical protein [bacterium]
MNGAGIRPAFFVATVNKLFDSQKESQPHPVDDTSVRDCALPIGRQAFKGGRND